MKLYANVGRILVSKNLVNPTYSVFYTVNIFYLPRAILLSLD